MKSNNTFKIHKLSSRSSIGLKAMEQDELTQLQEQFGELNKLHFPMESQGSISNESGFESLKMKLHSYLSPLN
jgi:hypothetical protein